MFVLNAAPPSPAEVAALEIAVFSAVSWDVTRFASAT
jgi:hypothetical protein